LKNLKLKLINPEATSTGGVNKYYMVIS
jgi:hypothetical protein